MRKEKLNETDSRTFLGLSDSLLFVSVRMCSRLEKGSKTHSLIFGGPLTVSCFIFHISDSYLKL